MEQTLRRNNTDEETLILMTKIEEYEKTFSFYKLEIERQKKKEINRMIKEFLTNDYQRRFNVTQQTLVSAIYGEDSMSNEYHRMIREQKVYFEKIKQCQSYHNSVQKNKVGN